MGKQLGWLACLVLAAVLAGGCDSGNSAAGGEGAYQYSLADLAGTWAISGDIDDDTVIFNAQGYITAIIRDGNDVSKPPYVQVFKSSQFVVTANGSVSGSVYMWAPPEMITTWTLAFKNTTTMSGIIHLTSTTANPPFSKKYAVTLTKQ